MCKHVPLNWDHFRKCCSTFGYWLKGMDGEQSLKVSRSGVKVGSLANDRGLRGGHAAWRWLLRWLDVVGDAPMGCWIIEIPRIDTYPTYIVHIHYIYKDKYAHKYKHILHNYVAHIKQSINVDKPRETADRSSQPPSLGHPSLRASTNKRGWRAINRCNGGKNLG